MTTLTIHAKVKHIQIYIQSFQISSSDINNNITTDKERKKVIKRKR